MAEFIPTAAATVAALNSISILLRGVAESAAKLKNRAIRRQVDEVLAAQTDLRAKVDALAQENSDLRAEVEKLNTRLRQRDEYVHDWKRNSVWKITPNGIEQGPYCPRCWSESNGQKAIPMADDDDGTHRCPVCKTYDRQPRIVGFVSVPITRG